MRMKILSFKILIIFSLIMTAALADHEEGQASYTISDGDGEKEKFVNLMWLDNTISTSYIILPPLFRPDRHMSEKIL